MTGGINVINGVRNAGNMPAISAGPTTPTTATVYQLFVSTFDNVLYYWNGTGWQPLGGSGSVPQLKTVLAVGNSGADGQVIDLYVDSTHNASYQGAQIAFYNGSGNTGVIKANTLVGNNSYALPSLSGTFLLNTNFTKGTVTLVGGIASVLDSNVTSNSVMIITRIFINGSTNIGTYNAVAAAGAGFSITSVKVNTTVETQDVSTLQYIIYY